MRKTFTINGKRYEVTGKTQKDIDDRYFYKRLEVEGLLTDKTVSDWCNEWLRRYKYGKVTEKNYKGYCSNVNKFILPQIGDKLLNKVTRKDCQNILNNMSGYSNYYIHKINFTLKGIFEMAVVEGLIDTNPALHLAKPKGKTLKRRSLTDDERKLFLQAIKGKNYELYFLLQLYCGLRPHEVSFIQGKDCNTNVLHVRGIKTKNADRYVPIPSFLGLPDIPPEEYLFKHLTEQKRNRWWNSLKKQLGDVSWTPYCLRHTYCTDLEKAGVPLNVAKQLMGHSDVRITSDIYTHTSEEVFRNIATTIEAFHTNSHIK